MLTKPRNTIYQIKCFVNMKLGIMKKMIFIYINPPEKERALLQLKSRRSRPLYSTITLRFISFFH